jgi:CheY-like chemotaxis protein
MRSGQGRGTIRAMGSGAPFAPVRIVAQLLVVDDDADVSDVVKDLLEGEGHTVRVAHNGQEGLDLLEHCRPSAVVLDVEMPVLDGPDMVFRMIIHNAGLERIPVVLVSGVADLPSVASRVGTPYYLSKPFDVNQFTKLVYRAIFEHVPPHPAT